MARVSVPLGLLLVEGWVWDAYCMLLTCTAVLLHAVNMHSCLTASCSHAQPSHCVLLTCTAVLLPTVNVNSHLIACC